METELHHSYREPGQLTAECIQKKTKTSVRTRLLRRLAGNERGQEMMEFALLLLFGLPPLIIGTIWIAQGISVYETLSRAAREGAEFALAPPCATCANANTTPTAAQVFSVIQQHVQAAGLNPGNLTNCSPPTNCVTWSNATSDSFNPTNYQQPWVTVTLVYPFTLQIPLTPVNAESINITSTVSMHGEF